MQSFMELVKSKLENCGSESPKEKKKKPFNYETPKVDMEELEAINPNSHITHSQEVIRKVFADEGI